MLGIDKATAKAEWQRLNPVFSAQPDNTWGVVKAAIKETIIGFWALPRMTWWLARIISR